MKVIHSHTLTSAQMRKVRRLQSRLDKIITEALTLSEAVTNDRDREPELYMQREQASYNLLSAGAKMQNALRVINTVIDDCQ